MEKQSNQHYQENPHLKLHKSNTLIIKSFNKVQIKFIN